MFAFEILIIAAIFFLQWIKFAQTRFRIKTLAEIIPRFEALEIAAHAVPDFHFATFSTPQLLQNLSLYRDWYLGDETDPEDSSSGATTVVLLLRTPASQNSVWPSIKLAINAYILRSAGSGTTFDTMRDITDRHTDAAEEEIAQEINVPLYLGLMGTIVGIIIGLSGIIFSDGNSTLDEQLAGDISKLLTGVAIAMGGSFTGLFFTTINSGYNLRTSKRLLDNRKNDFFTLLQTELIPRADQSAGSQMAAFQANLSSFNGEFKTNLGQLSTIFTRTYDTLRLQESILDKMETQDMANIVKYNVKVMAELQKSVAHLEGFTHAMGDLEGMMKNMRAVTTSAASILSRTNDFGAIATDLGKRLNESQRLIEFLNSHFTALESRKGLISMAVGDVDNHLSHALAELKKHTQDQFQALEEVKVSEYNEVNRMLKESSGVLEKLHYLEKVNGQLTKLVADGTTNTEQLSQRLDALHQQMEKSAETLDTMKHNNLLYAAKSLANRLFKP